jgi:hypothetical protein
MPLLDPFEAEQQSFKLIFPRKGTLDTHPQGMDRFVEEAFASALGHLAVAQILFDVGDEARIENALPIACGIKAAIEVNVNWRSELLQRLQEVRNNCKTRNQLGVLQLSPTSPCSPL